MSRYYQLNGVISVFIKRQEETAVLRNSRTSKPAHLEGDIICPLVLSSLCRAVNAFSHSTFSESLMDKQRTQKHLNNSLKPIFFLCCTRAKDNISLLPVPCSSPHKLSKTCTKKGWKKTDKKTSPVFRDVFMLFFSSWFPRGDPLTLSEGRCSSRPYPTRLRASIEQVPSARCQCGHLQHAHIAFGKCFLTRSAGRSICHAALDKLWALALSPMKYVRMLCMRFLSNPPSLSA